MKLIILDRDGTINHDSDEYIKSPEEWKPIKGSLEAIARLTHAGYRIAVARCCSRWRGASTCRSAKPRWSATRSATSRPPPRPA
jgi:hypothetical protein